MTIRLPFTVFDDSLSALIELLGQVDSTPNQEVVVVDFQSARFYVPSAMVALLSIVKNWSAAGRMIVFHNIESCECVQYFQRMNFFSLSGIDLPEKFVRRDSQGKFVPLCEVSGSLSGKVDKISSALAGCIFPSMVDSDDPEQTGPYDVIEYAASELINNVIQHAKGTGYVAAQVYQKSEMIRLCVTDCGIGIRKSFEEGRPDFWDDGMSHLDAVRTALQPEASSKMHLQAGWGYGPVNAGVGLSMLKEIARHADGLFTLISGDGFYQHIHLEKRSLPFEIQMRASFNGTLCALQLSKQKLGNLQEILQIA